MSLKEYYVSELRFEPDSEPRQVSTVNFRARENSPYVSIPVIERGAYDRLKAENSKLREALGIAKWGLNYYVKTRDERLSAAISSNFKSKDCAEYTLEKIEQALKDQT